MPRIAWKPILLEATFVVLGVVLALGLNEWRQHAAREAQAREALASIQAEIVANRAAIAESEAYHDQLMQTLWPLRLAGAPPPDMRAFSQGFVHPARVVSTAWDTAQRTGAFSHIDYAMLLTLGQAYAQQESYAVQSEQVGPLIYRAMFEGGTESIRLNYANLLDLIRAFWYRERQVIAQYDSTLAALGVAPASDSAGVPMPQGHPARADSAQENAP